MQKVWAPEASSLYATGQSTSTQMRKWGDVEWRPE
jgi:hypothetical protein